MKLISYFLTTSGLRLALVAILIIQVLGVSAQTIDVGPPDTSICGGDPIDLTAITSGIGGGGSTSPVIVNLTDDTHSGVVDMGFDFEYFGNTYNQCVIASNSYVTFDLAQANQYSPWGINAASPNPAASQLRPRTNYADWNS